MRLFASLLPFSSASHYRGGSYKFAPDGQGKFPTQAKVIHKTFSGQTSVTTTQTWRDTSSGYTREFNIFT